MTHRLSLALAAAPLALFGCSLFGGAASGTDAFTLDVSSPAGSNVKATSYAATAVAGNWNISPPLDGGWSIISGSSPVAAISGNCTGVALGFEGKPATGRQVRLDAPVVPDDGGVALTADGGAVDLTGRGTLVFQEGCLTAGALNQWRSTGGTLTIDSVENATTPGADSSIKLVKFSYSNAAMAADNNGVGQGGAAQGTFSANGHGVVNLFTGAGP